MAVYKMLKFENGSNVYKCEVEFTNEELDAIYSAMSDYEHYGEEEHEIADSISFKLSVLG